jgi:aldehyde dehydrogenase (NAD+)
MKTIDKIYIKGAFVVPHGKEVFNLYNPSNNQLIGEVTLGDETDTRNAISAAKEAFRSFSKTGKEERIVFLQRCMMQR